MSDIPTFIIIGAMKSATTTLHEQLARQPGFFMTSKVDEPSFFSDDRNYARGMGWYQELFSSRGAAAICGESSTDYTKLPDLPQTVERMRRHLPQVKLIYVMRQPVDRLVSHYIHDWSQHRINEPIGKAIHHYPDLINYGRYSMQLKPYLEAYGSACILPMFFENLVLNPKNELKRVFHFLGYKEDPEWHPEEAVQNASKDRLRKSALRDAIIWNPLVTWFRRTFVPQSIRDWAKSWYQMRERPALDAADIGHLETIFDEDIAVLGKRLGLKMSCKTWRTIAETVEPRWVE